MTLKRLIHLSTLLLSISLVSLSALADIDPKERAVNNYIKALNTADLSIIKGMYAEISTLEDPVGAPVVAGRDAVVAFYKEAFKLGLTAELTGPIRIAGNSAAFSFNASYGNTKMEIIDVFVFDKSNKVTSMKAYWSEANVSKVVKSSTPRN